MNEELERSQRLLACLGDRSRFRVVTELLVGEYCVSELARQVGLSQSCTTRHLQVLEREGLVNRVRKGKRVFFQLREGEPGIDGLIEWAMTRTAPAGPWRPMEPGAPVVRSQTNPTKRTQPSEPEDDPRPGDLDDFLL